VLGAIAVIMAALAIGWATKTPQVLFHRSGQPRPPADALSSERIEAVPQAPATDTATAPQRTPADPPAPAPAVSTGSKTSAGAAAASSDSAAATQAGPPRPPAASGTELIVSTDPAGGRVTVNGIGWGLAPVTIRHLSPGTKRIRVTKEGYTPEERVVTLVDGEPQSLDIRLTSLQ
jgi:hypothetical protein